MKRHFFISTLLLIACTLSTTAQNVSGYVFDAKDGEPIVGATVLCGTLGCMTNVDGYFSLKASPGSKITVKYIGMKTKTVSASSNMQIAMGKGPYQLVKRVPSASKTNNLSQSYSAKKSEPDNQASNVTRTQTPSSSFATRKKSAIELVKYPFGCMPTSTLSKTRDQVADELRNKTNWKLDLKSTNTLFANNIDLQWGGVNIFSASVFWNKYGNSHSYTFIAPSGKEGKNQAMAFVRELQNSGISMREGKTSTYESLVMNGECGALKIGLSVHKESGYWSINISHPESTTAVYSSPTNTSTSSSSSSGSYSSSGTSSSSSSYSSSSSSSSNSQYGRLLFQGTYTLTGMVRNGLSVTATGQPALQKMTIYEKYMIPEGMKTLPYRGNTTIYGETGRKYGLNDDMFFLVTSNGLVRLISVFRVTMPIVGNVEDVKMAYYDIGDTRAAYAGRVLGGNNPVNSYNGGNVNSGGSVNTPNRQRNCNHCHGTGWCPTCNHTGWVVNRYSKGQSPCPNCNPNGERVFNPNRGKCPLCGGTGKR